MKIIKGINVAPGIAIGRALLVSDDAVAIPQYEITEEQLQYELERFQEALEKAEVDLRKLKEEHTFETDEAQRRFLDAHLLMLQDPEFIGQVKEELAQERKNVEWILARVCREMIGRIDALEDDYIRERSVDIRDVGRRILGHLMQREEPSLAHLEKEVILVAHNLLPSDVISMNKRFVIGIATDMGGKTSHVAILARSFEIPTVLGLSTISRGVQTGDELIVDGNQGVVVVQPDETTKTQYQGSREAWRIHELQLFDLTELPAETRDGKRILLEANIEVPEEVVSAKTHGADGIGLYRSEFLYILPNRFPTEEEQLAAYRSVLQAMKPKSVTMRTLDLGGDKVIPGVIPGSERNPILGWRAVRFCLSRPDVFKIQLRALLRASMYGNLKIMFPMISGIEELQDIMAVLEEAKGELDRQGHPYRRDVPVGVMIEVPSAAITSDLLARSVSFFSIGTNDLIQYMIAVDRENERIAYLYEPFHPAVLRIIKMVIDSAHRYGIPVGMCGEMAGDVQAAVVLLGLGLDEFSMSSFGIPEIKKIIRSVALAEAEEVVGAIMEMRSYHDIDRFISNWMGARFESLADRPR